MSLALAAALLSGAAAPGPSAPPARGDLHVRWEAPELFVAGVPYVARVELVAVRGEAVCPAWQLTAAGFAAGGNALGRRAGSDEVCIAEGDTLVVWLDLSDEIAGAGVRDDFPLTHASSGDQPSQALAVDVLTPAPPGLDFTTMNQGALSQYRVLLHTNRGDMLLELWTEDAPNHVRNFLDLSYTGFYDGTVFHRVVPGFMIQGGDPEGTGLGRGPRSLAAEFNSRSHARGVLSMARAADPDSASCQFFVMHADSPHLDGQYTAFGRMLVGSETLDAIATASGTPIPGGGGTRPAERQTIERAVVVLADNTRR